jgi:uncharacterized protein (TIGR01777 family)
MSTFEHTSIIDATPGELWAWHRAPGALERLVPPWERVEILSRVGGVEDGGRLELRVGRAPFAFRMTVRHRDASPGRGFTDEQVEGPFGRWEHQHRMEVAGPGRSRLTDRVEYEAPLGPLGSLGDSLLIRRRLERGFRYRHATVAEDLAAHRRARLPPHTIAITGASGLVGSALVPFLTTGGHTVRRVVRRRPEKGEIAWDPEAGMIEPQAFEGLDAVVHLAGESIAERWTAERKQRIRRSRVEGTRLLAETLAGLARPPRVLVSASAMGIYGERGDEELTEASAPGTGFLAQVGEEWEAATGVARSAGIRVVHARFSLVLTPAGGTLGRMLLPFEAGGGARLGNGRQWWSWVSIDDAIGLLLHAIATPSVTGPLNVAAPGAQRNRAFTETLGDVLGRPTLLAVPRGALRLALGELADAALTSARVLPTVAARTGYVFRHPDLRQALRHVLGR